MSTVGFVIHEGRPAAVAAAGALRASLEENGISCVELRGSAADVDLVVGGVVRIDVRGTVAGRGEAADERRFIGTAAPGEPAKVAGLRAVIDVGDDGPD